jgi:hypothetical protein
VSRERIPPWDLALFGLIPVMVTVWLLHEVYAHGISAVDFRHDFWVAGLRVAHGGNPYAWTRGQIAAGASFPYPALAGVLLAPFGLISRDVSAGLFTALCIASVLLTLRVLDVRDWRIYGVALLFSPVVTGWQTANMTLPLLPGIALAWRYRDRPAVAGTIVALLVSIKPIIAPLVLWLFATRRVRAGIYSVAGAALLNAAAWGIVGLGEIPNWLHLLGVQGDMLYAKGYGVIAVAAHLGLSRGAGTAVAMLLAILMAVALVWKGRRNEDIGAFSLAVLLMIVASPQVDGHYFALMIVPLAIRFPTLRAVWFAPLALWVCPAAEAVAWQELVWWVVVGYVTVELLLRGDAPAAPRSLRDSVVSPAIAGAAR